MFKKIIDWLNWNVRINFIDNVWWPLFGKEEAPTIKMTAIQLGFARLGMGLSQSQMAKMLCVTKTEYQRYEKDGLLAPHETQGSIICIIRIIESLRKQNQEHKDMLDMLGYNGKMLP